MYLPLPPAWFLIRGEELELEWMVPLILSVLLVSALHVLKASCFLLHVLAGLSLQTQLKLWLC